LRGIGSVTGGADRKPTAEPSAMSVITLLVEKCAPTTAPTARRGAKKKLGAPSAEEIRPYRGVQPSESLQRKRRDRAGMTNYRKAAVALMRPLHWPISVTVAGTVNAVTMSWSTLWAHGVVHGWT
jgi:hypothetical protein